MTVIRQPAMYHPDKFLEISNLGNEGSGLRVFDFVLSCLASM